MFNDDNGRTMMKKRLKDAQQNLYIQRMQTDGGLIKDEYGILLGLSNLAGKLEPLRLASGQSGRFLAKGQVAESELL